MGGRYCKDLVVVIVKSVKIDTISRIVLIFFCQIVKIGEWTNIIITGVLSAWKHKHRHFIFSHSGVQLENELEPL